MHCTFLNFYFLLPQYPHKQAVIILLATRCTKCNKTGPCHKLSFLPSPDWPNSMQTNQWNSLMSFTGYSTRSPIRELNHGHLFSLLPSLLDWDCFFNAFPFMRPTLGVQWLCLARTFDYNKLFIFLLCFFSFPLVSAPDWPSPQRIEKMKSEYKTVWWN